MRSYAFDLLRWWRWLEVVGVAWDKATPAEVRDLVLWLLQASKPRRSPRMASTGTAGSVNPITGKQYLDDRYKPRTVRHANAVLRSFYEFWMEVGAGPVINPVQLDRRELRPNAHHNPLEPFRPEGRIRYNPQVPKRRPREIPDELWRQMFVGPRSNRDRAILAITISTSGRASEILGVRWDADLDWGDQLVRVFRKGTGAEQWLPASPDAFVWIRLYLNDLGAPLRPNSPLWRTLREPITLPEPLAGLARHLVATRQGHAAIGDQTTSPWLFPGGQPGRPISAFRLAERLRHLGIRSGQSRSTALFQLATDLPAALLARMLGIHITVAVAWQRASSGDWAAYAAAISRRTRTGQ